MTSSNHEESFNRNDSNQEYSDGKNNGRVISD